MKGEKPLKVHGTLDDILKAAMSQPEPLKALEPRRKALKKRPKKK